MDAVKGGMYTDFEQFNDDVQVVLLESPKSFRFVLFGEIRVKVTNDVKCLQFVVQRAADLKKFDHITARIMQFAVTPTA
ncbi:hypothetical protein M3Y99_01855600 [Aphelenchoides fujianensis]|nr:hypothetical protein M3Y99_01855600 [Aphelenchoides fujianensis]